MDFDSLGKLLLLGGLLLAFAGGLLIVLSRVTGTGRLPGDISVRAGGLTFFFPIVSCIVISIVLTVLLNVIARLIR